LEKQALKAIGSFSTADLVDAYGGRVRSCAIQFRNYGKLNHFYGPVRTISTLEDNLLIRRTLAEAGRGAVLVVSGGGSLRCALLGDLLASLGQGNGWTGLVVWGAVRDVAALRDLGIGIKALGSNPWKSSKLGTGSVDVPIDIGDFRLNPGEWLYSDEDGLVVSDARLALENSNRGRTRSASRRFRFRPRP
jgi:regulator of ribonuclease activity A